MTSALVVIDVQRDAMAVCPAAERVLATINALIAGARHHDVPLVFVQHQGQDLPVGADGWHLDSHLDNRIGDTVIAKEFRDAFAETRLGEVLRHSGVSRLVIVGVHSDFCVQTTALSALAHGYDIALVNDGHAAEAAVIAGVHVPAEVITEFVNARMTTLRYPGRRVEVLAASQVVFV